MRELVASMVGSAVESGEAFAGGRDTVIHTISSVLVYLAQHAEAIDFLREDETRITTATEEFVRYVSPVTI